MWNWCQHENTLLDKHTVWNITLVARLNINLLKDLVHILFYCNLLRSDNIKIVPGIGSNDSTGDANITPLRCYRNVYCIPRLVQDIRSRMKGYSEIGGASVCRYRCDDKDALVVQTSPRPPEPQAIRKLLCVNQRSLSFTCHTFSMRHRAYLPRRTLEILAPEHL